MAFALAQSFPRGAELATGDLKHYEGKSLRDEFGQTLAQPQTLELTIEDEPRPLDPAVCSNPTKRIRSSIRGILSCP